jgi:hypothetical protein
LVAIASSHELPASEVFEEKTNKTWTVVGGSYAGAVSAWAREKNSDVISASWSSSGVVEAIYNFTAFDQAVAGALSPACEAAIHAVTAAFEQAWEVPASRVAMLALFNTPAADFSQADFAWMLADSAAMGVQYGFKEAMCAYLVPAPADGYLKAFARWTIDHYGADFGSSCYYSTACLSDPSRYNEWYNAKTWVWQCCYQLAYWQASYEGSLRSSVITTDYFMQQCQSAFGPTLPPVDVDAFNARYGGDKPPTTSVTASQGSDDPWRMAGVQAPIDPVTYPEFLATCDGCGHCRDLHASDPSDPASLTQQRESMAAAIVGWIGASA